LQSVYPEHVTSSKNKSHRYWQDIQNQRKFFDSIAQKYEVYKPEDWQRITAGNVLKEGGSFIKSYYQGSVIQGNPIFTVTEDYSATVNLS
jgi:hypothetical protein